MDYTKYFQVFQRQKDIFLIPQDLFKNHFGKQIQGREKGEPTSKALDNAFIEAQIDTLFKRKKLKTTQTQKKLYNLTRVSGGQQQRSPSCMNGLQSPPGFPGNPVRGFLLPVEWRCHLPPPQTVEACFLLLSTLPSLCWENGLRCLWLEWEGGVWLNKAA